MHLSIGLRSARTLFAPDGTAQRRDPRRFRKRALPTRLCVGRLEDRTVPSTFTVQNLADSGPDSLRAAIVAANANPGADVIAFAPVLQGTVTLTSGELAVTDSVQIDGPGANRLAVSGNDVSRIFNIGSGAAVSIDGLTVTHGHGLLRGGGILNAGVLTLTHAVVSDNEVVGLPGSTPAVDAFGGGVLNTGTLTVSHTVFVGNKSNGADGNPGGPGSTALGGAILSSGTAAVSHCTFLDNQAAGGAAGPGATFSRAGIGGAITNTNGTMTISHSDFTDNLAVGGAGGAAPGSAGIGGAIANVALLADTTLTVSHCIIQENMAVGGAAPAGTSSQPGRGGGIANYVAPIATIPVSATASVDHTTIVGNEAIGGAGPTGGTGQGGGIANEFGGVLTVTHSTIILNRAVGSSGVGGNGDNGFGGGVFNGAPTPFGTPTITLQKGLVAFNLAEGGAGGGGAGAGRGGGVYVVAGGVASADGTAIFANDASTDDDDVFGNLILL